MVNTPLAARKQPPQTTMVRPAHLASSPAILNGPSPRGRPVRAQTHQPVDQDAPLGLALFWLSDKAWAVIEPHLPQNQPGTRRVDDRSVISGILHVLKVGCRWCDRPAEYGPSTTIYNRFNRWSRRGFWLRLLEARVEAQTDLNAAAG